MSEPDDPLAPWTDRLLRLDDGDGVAPEAARSFVHDLYVRAQADIDKERAEAEFEREE
ncbi:hypothetical protein ACFC36_23635 [Streptomyces rubiginosohelvolus]|uniref:hypothetical protein n=1 Tax=Streptomyces rubiginosohelvolus TaxID=67362 RepID=UPI0035D594C9